MQLVVKRATVTVLICSVTKPALVFVCHDDSGVVSGAFRGALELPVGLS